MVAEKNEALFPWPPENYELRGARTPLGEGAGPRGGLMVLEGAGQAREVSAEEKVLDLCCEGHTPRHVVMWDFVCPRCSIPSPRASGVGAQESSGRVC